MPLPLLIGAGIGIVGTVIGAKKALDAKRIFAEAKRIGEEAQAKYKISTEKFKLEADKTELNMAELGKLKLQIQSKTMMEFVREYKRFQNANLSTKELENINIKKELTGTEIKNFENKSLKATDLLGGGMKGLTTGALASIGAMGLAQSIGVASTGTAISTLSGAAATNAALAWLGGGSLAAGGLGIAGGTAILGGIVVGPALAIMGFSMASKAEKALTQAKEYEAEVDISIEKLELAKTALTGIQKRSDEVYSVTKRLHDRLKSIINKMRSIRLKSEKSDLRSKCIFNALIICLILLITLLGIILIPLVILIAVLYYNHKKDKVCDKEYITEEEQKTLYIAANLASMMSKVLDVNIVDKNGSASSESGRLVQEINQAI